MTVRMLVRLSLRRRAAGAVALALLVGISGGAVLASAAGARRTASAYDRMVRATSSDVVLVSSYGPGRLGFYQEVEALPEVAESGTVVAVTLAPVEDGAAPFVALGLVSAEGRAGFDLAGFKLLEGRLPDPNAPLEALANHAFAREAGLQAGRSIDLRLFAGDEPEDSEAVRPDEGRPVRLVITGVGIAPEEVLPSVPLDAEPKLILGPAFLRSHVGLDDQSFDGIFVRLQPGVAARPFLDEVERIVTGHPEAGGRAITSIYADKQIRATRAIRPQAAALAVFAIVTALVSLLVLGQGISRHLSQDAAAYPVLRALGVTPRQIVTAEALRVTAVAGAGAIIAVGIALATSPLMPIGPARLAEPQPGFEANVALLAAGALSIVVALSLWTLIPVMRGVSSLMRARAPRSSRGVLGDRLWRAPLPAPARLGMRAALAPGGADGTAVPLRAALGGTAAPVRAALAGTSLAIATLTGSLVFASALDRMVSDPRSFGWNWDTMLDTQFGVLPTSMLLEQLGDPAVEGWSGGIYGSLTIGGREVPAIGLDRMRGSVTPTLLAGRAPAAADEIALGPRTLREAGAQIGESIDVRINSLGERNPAGVRMRIVGSVVFPTLGRGTFVPTGLGDGALTLAGPLHDPEVAAQQGGSDPEDRFNFALVRFRPGSASEAFRLEREIRSTEACTYQDCGALTEADRRPTDIANYARIRGTQGALVVLLFALAALTVAHALITTVRRRRRDIAVLKTLGFSRRQVSSMVMWQATTTAAVSLAIGIPAGIALGRWAWSAFASSLGVPAVVPIPLATIVLAAAVLVVLSNVAAASPARTARRVHPAVVLRAE